MEQKQPVLSELKDYLAESKDSYVVFTDWTLWTDRKKIGGLKNPGVYVLAHFAKPPRTKDLQAKEIIYVGETCDQSLLTRWGQFNRSALNGTDGHSGGKTYWSLFHGKRMEQLYLTALPVDGLCGDLCSVFIRYLERKLILEYTVKWGKLPICNLK